MARKPFDAEAILAAIARGERSCGDLEMRIDRDGGWHYRGSPIARAALVRLFASVLHRAEDGTYWLVTPGEQGRVEVEDAPFVAVEVLAEGADREQRIRFRTNLDEWVELDEAHPLRLEARPGRGGAELPYLLVRGRLEARVARPVFYHLAELAEPSPEAGDPRVGVWSAGRFFPLGLGDG